jgi:hypothetical protein
MEFHVAVERQESMNLFLVELNLLLVSILAQYLVLVDILAFILVILEIVRLASFLLQKCVLVIILN